MVRSRSCGDRQNDRSPPLCGEVRPCRTARPGPSHASTAAAVAGGARNPSILLPAVALRQSGEARNWSRPPAAPVRADGSVERAAGGTGADRGPRLDASRPRAPRSAVAGATFPALDRAPDVQRHLTYFCHSPCSRAPARGNIRGLGSFHRQQCGGAGVTVPIGDQIIALLPRLRRFARGLAKSVADLDDLVQAACERALARAHQWQPGTRFDSWMFRIAQVPSGSTRCARAPCAARRMPSIPRT